VRESVARVRRSVIQSIGADATRVWPATAGFASQIEGQLANSAPGNVTNQFAGVMSCPVSATNRRQQMSSLLLLRVAQQ